MSRRNYSPVTLSPQDAALAASWRQAGLPESAIRAGLKAAATESRKLEAARIKTTNRVVTRRNAIAFLQEETFLVAGIKVTGIQAIQFHLAFQPLVGAIKNPNVPVAFAQAVVSDTYDIIRGVQEQFGGVESFPMDAASLKKLVLLADRVEGMPSYLDEELAEEEDLVA